MDSVDKWIDGIKEIGDLMRDLEITGVEAASEALMKQPEVSLLLNLPRARKLAPALKKLIERGQFIEKAREEYENRG